MLMPPNLDHLKPTITIERTVLADLLAHAAAAARIVGHLDDSIATGPLSDHIDAVVHELSELIGAARTTAALNAVTTSESVAYDGAPTLTAAADGVP
jgi:hypothetical protein